MRRTVALGVAAIALLTGSSLALVVWLTEPRWEPAPRPSTPLSGADTQSPTTASRTVAELPIPGLAAAPPEVTPDAEAPAEEAPLPAVAPEVDLTAGAPALEAVVTRRCGRMRLEPLRAADEGTGSGAGAVLLLTLATEAGRARVVDSAVHARGKTRPSLVACARWALRDQVVTVSGVEPGRRLEVPVTIGVEPAR